MTLLKTKSCIEMPFYRRSGPNGKWPAITESTLKCCPHRRQHRLYHAIGRPCPCGPPPMVINEVGIGELRVYGDDIVCLNKDGNKLFSITDLLERIQALEEEVEKLKGK